MKVIWHENASSFLELNESKLLVHECENNLVLGLANAASKQPSDFPEAIFCTIEQNGEFLHAMRTDNTKAFLISKSSPGLVSHLVKELRSKNEVVNGISAPRECAEKFVELWNKDNKLVMNNELYELKRVIDPIYRGVGIRIANEDDISLATTLLVRFKIDCFGDGANVEEEMKKIAIRLIKNKGLYFWLDENKEVVSCAACSRETQNSAIISYVYTPEDKRGNGFGKMVTAALSSELLKNGKTFCSLFADAKNPISNRIYQKIGYKKVGEHSYFEFF